MSISLACPSLCHSRSIDLSVKVYNSISQIDEGVWKSLIPREHTLMQHAYLNMLEKLHAHAMKFRYVTVYERDELVGCIYFQIVNFSGKQLTPYIPRNFSTLSSAVTAGVLRQLRARLLVCGNVFMTGEDGCYFANSPDVVKRTQILNRAINEIMYQKSADAVLLGDIYSESNKFDDLTLLQQYHLIHIESDMTMDMHAEWKSFDDYLASLSSKYRVRAKRVYTICREAGVMMRDADELMIRDLQHQLYALYTQVMDKSRFSLARVSPNFFLEHKKILGNRYKVYTYYLHQDLIGFITAIHTAGRLEIHYTGMQHNLARALHLYQRMMYDMVNLGISLGVKRLHFGRTAPEIKSTIGATPVPMHGYLKHRHPLINYCIIKPLSSRLKPPAYLYRNPFKEVHQ
ncbi:MAG: GNAT family N-acetyltransferase [Chitinophagales bacterium]|nr:GNAT family N-acetyltransferase [Chitinophagales bacterium]MDW8418197.1 GNAT family N-acetyltransferase [Chitinophagales bacterium]